MPHSPSTDGPPGPLVWGQVARTAAAAAAAEATHTRATDGPVLPEPLLLAGLELAGIEVETDRALGSAVLAAVLAGLSLGEVTDAICAGWPGLDHVDARQRVDGYLHRQARHDRALLGWKDEA